MPRLPPLNALRAFEAAARHLSMKAASEELHVTRGAVSQLVRVLEDRLGVRLFTRVNRRLVPPPPRDGPKGCNLKADTEV